MHFLKKNYGLFVVLILSFWVIKPLFIPGFFPIHDDTQVARVFEMGKALKDGMFPVRWVSDLGYGYGYPIFNFYSPLPYYVGGFLTFFTDPLFVTKLMFIIGVLLSGIFMYLLAREFWGKLGGTVSALFYLYAPYHALDIYVRGAVGEFWAYAFIPLTVLGLYKVFQKGTWGWVVVGAVSYSGIILSHNLTALMITPFLIALIIILGYSSYRRDKNILATCYLLLTTFLGLAISAFYWLPALLEMKHANVLSQIGGGADFRNHFVCIQQLWESPWGFGGSVPGCIDGLSFKIGKLHILASLLAFIGSIYMWKKDRLRSVIVISSFLFLVLSLFMTLEITKPVWETFSIMAFLQYPWRFLLLASFFSSLLVGFLSLFFQRLPKQRLFAVGLVLLLLYLNLKLFAPQTIFSKTYSDYTNKPYLNWTASKISDEYMPKGFKKPKTEEELPKTTIEIVEGKGTVEDIRVKTGRISAEVKAEEEIILKFNVAYFPAWRIFKDGKTIAFRVEESGISTKVLKGDYKIEARFNQTLIEKLSNVTSIIGVLLLFTGIIYTRRKNILYGHKKTER